MLLQNSTDSTDKLIKVIPFFYGWVILFVAALVHFSSAPGQTYVSSIFIDHMIDDLGWSRTTFSSLYTAGSMTAAIFMVAAGRALDKFGARKTLTTLCLMMFLATFWMSGVDSLWKLFVGYALLRTIGQGSFGLVATTMVSTWFIRIRGRATAISSVGGAASLALFPFIVHILIERFDWRNTWFILGIVVLIVLFLPALVLIRRSPEAVGLRPDGVTYRMPETGGDSDKEPTEANFTLAEALKTKSLWMLVFGSTAMPLIMTGLMFHHVSILGAGGISPGLAALTMGLFGPLVFLGSLACGYLADRIPNRFLLAAGQFILILAMLWTIIISAPWQAIIYIFLASISMSLMSTPNTVIWANYFGRTNLGSIRGFATTVMVAFSAMGALPFGLIYDRTGSYDDAIFILLILPVIAGIAYMLAKEPKLKSKLNVF